MCMHVCIYLCMYVCMYVCMCVWMNECICMLCMCVTGISAETLRAWSIDPQVKGGMTMVLMWLTYLWDIHSFIHLYIHSSIYTSIYTSINPSMHPSFAIHQSMVAMLWCYKTSIALQPLLYQYSPVLYALLYHHYVCLSDNDRLSAATSCYIRSGRSVFDQLEDLDVEDCLAKMVELNEQ